MVLLLAGSYYYTPVGINDHNADFYLPVPISPPIVSVSDLEYFLLNPLSLSSGDNLALVLLSSHLVLIPEYIISVPESSPVLSVIFSFLLPVRYFLVHSFS